MSNAPVNTTPKEMITEYHFSAIQQLKEAVISLFGTRSENGKGKPSLTRRSQYGIEALACELTQIKCLHNQLALMKLKHDKLVPQKVQMGHYPNTGLLHHLQVGVFAKSHLCCPQGLCSG